MTVNKNIQPTKEQRNAKNAPKQTVDKYEQALKKYNNNLNDDEVRETVKKLIEEKVHTNDTPEVKKFLFGSIELTSLKCTDSDESIMAFTEKVNQFDTQYADLPHVATICVYPCFAQVVRDTLEVEGVEIACVSGSFPSSQALIEVKVAETALDVQIGSITGGGRYDNLTGIFGMPGLSGVGISFGADRIYDVLNTLDLYPKSSVTGTQLLFINFGEKEMNYVLPFVAQARKANIRTEIFPDSVKMKKQMAYANAKNIPFVVLAGDSEIEQGKVTLKDMESGEQTLVSSEELISKLGL